VEGVWVFGGIERDSNPPKCFFVPVQDRSAAMLIPIIKQWIKPGTTAFIFRDERLKADKDFIVTMRDDVAGIRIDDLDILKCIRLGAYSDDKVRPLLITMSDENIRDGMLRMGKAWDCQEKDTIESALPPISHQSSVRKIDKKPS